VWAWACDGSCNLCYKLNFVLQDIPEAEGDNMTGLYIEEAVEAEDLIYSPEPKVVDIAILKTSFFILGSDLDPSRELQITGGKIVRI
jgi:hypothetical protein